MEINWKKILAAVVGLVILAGISYLVLWLRPKTMPNDVPPGVQNGSSTVANDISSWKTYRNDEYGFGLSYPVNAELSVDTYEVVGGSNIMLGGKVPAVTGNITSNRSLVAFFYFYPAPFNTTKEQVNFEIIARRTYKEVSVDSFSGFEFQLSGARDGEIQTFVFLPNGVLEFVCNGEWKDLCSSDSSKQILKTLNSTWKRYKNEEYGFEFMYPPEWREGDIWPYGNDTDLVFDNNKKDCIAIHGMGSSLGYYCIKMYVAAFPKGVFIGANSAPPNWENYISLIKEYGENNFDYVYDSIQTNETQSHRKTLFYYNKGNKFGNKYSYGSGRLAEVFIELSPTSVLNMSVDYDNKFESEALLSFGEIVSTLKFSK